MEAWILQEQLPISEDFHTKSLEQAMCCFRKALSLLMGKDSLIFVHVLITCNMICMA